MLFYLQQQNDECPGEMTNLVTALETVSYTKKSSSKNV